MIFSSFSFLVFLIATLALYGAARNTRERAALMLAASLIFYASWKPAYLLLLMASLGVNYLLYLRIVASPRGRQISGLLHRVTDRAGRFRRSCGSD